MPGERAEFQVTIDATQARAELNRLRAAQEEAVGFGGKLDGTIKGLQQRMQPAAAAISSVAAALGDQNNEAGKAIAMGGQFLAAWSAGGPFGLALALAGAGVIKLTQYWDDLLKKQDEALNRTYSATDQATRQLNQVEDQLLSLKEQTMNSSAAAYQRVGAEIDAVKAKQDNLRKSLIDENGLRRRQQELAEAGLNADAIASQQTLDENDNKKQAIALYDKIIEKLEKKQALEAAAAAGGTGGDVAKTLNDKDKALADQRAKAELNAQAQLDDALDQLYRDRLQKRAEDEQTLIEQSIAIYEQMADGQKEADALADEEYEAHIKREQAANARFMASAQELAQAAIVQPMQAATSEAFDVFQEYIDMKVKGEKDAEAKVAAEFMKSVGKQLVGIGLQAEFAGAAKLFDPVTAPIGLAQMAFGAAAIGAGVGLGAGGSAVAASIPEAKGGGAAGRAITDRGVNSGGSRGGGGGGGTTVINITNGALVGPAPQDQGRAVLETLRRYGQAAGNSGFQNIQGPRR